MHSGFICFKAITLPLTESLLPALKQFSGSEEGPTSTYPDAGDQSAWPPLTIVLANRQRSPLVPCLEQISCGAGFKIVSQGEKKLSKSLTQKKCFGLFTALPETGFYF